MSKTQKTILIVDDNKDTLELMSDIFTSNGYVIKKAANAVQAFSIFSENVDLVLTDLDMPGINGLKMTELLKKESNVPMVAITGLKVAKAPIFDAILHKPVRPKDLLQTVEDLIERFAP